MITPAKMASARRSDAIDTSSLLCFSDGRCYGGVVKNGSLRVFIDEAPFTFLKELTTFRSPA
jgi:hypothetical protein